MKLSKSEAYSLIEEYFSSGELPSVFYRRVGLSDNLQEVILKMSDELRNLRRMMFGRKSERFISEDPAQLSLSFEGVEELEEEREVEAIKAKEVQPAITPKKQKSDNKCERRVFAEHLERRDEVIEPDTIPDGSKRIGEEITELLEYKPGELYVRRLIRPKYALKDGEGVIIAPIDLLT